MQVWWPAFSLVVAQHYHTFGAIYRQVLLIVFAQFGFDIGTETGGSNCRVFTPATIPSYFPFIKQLMVLLMPSVQCHRIAAQGLTDCYVSHADK
ncbi:hypothetical protein AB833_00635 [Chromatiales bacterium (ex Bugula neritina AB1)]|nr:hypothetical protein AB833_00635 [Chromatiales bacterium (ex Bugula neritina AB1)]